MTPEEIGKHIAYHETTYKANPNGINEPDALDCDALAVSIAAAIRNVYLQCARLVDNGGNPQWVAANILRLRDGLPIDEYGRDEDDYERGLTELLSDHAAAS